jgi:hypothetical protein
MVSGFVSVALCWGGLLDGSSFQSVANIRGTCSVYRPLTFTPLSASAEDGWIDADKAGQLFRFARPAFIYAAPGTCAAGAVAWGVF